MLYGGGVAEEIQHSQTPRHPRLSSNKSTRRRPLHYQTLAIPTMLCCNHFIGGPEHETEINIQREFSWTIGYQGDISDLDGRAGEIQQHIMIIDDSAQMPRRSYLMYVPLPNDEAAQMILISYMIVV